MSAGLGEKGRLAASRSGRTSPACAPVGRTSGARVPAAQAEEVLRLKPVGVRAGVTLPEPSYGCLFFMAYSDSVCERERVVESGEARCGCFTPACGHNNNAWSGIGKRKGRILEQLFRGSERYSRRSGN